MISRTFKKLYKIAGTDTNFNKIIKSILISEKV